MQRPPFQAKQEGCREANGASLFRFLRPAVRESWGGWRIAALFLAALALTPMGAILLSFLEPTGDVLQHVAETRLWELVTNTAKLALGVGSLTLLLGVSLAWLTAQCDFPGRRFFSWALLLPMAIPAYVLAFTFLGLLDFSGPVQTALRALFGRGVWFPDVRGTMGVSVVLSLTLYPYIYLLARNAFSTQGTRAVEAAQSLGISPKAAFWKVSLPLARPWIAGGLALVLMETLADFGAVSIFNYDTFTTAVYQAWFGFFSLAAAAQLSSLLLVLALILITLEQRSRAKMRFYPPGRGASEAATIKLKGATKWGALLYATLVLAIAFVIPVSQLLLWSSEVFGEEFGSRYLTLLGNTVGLSVSAVLVIVTASVLTAYASRRHRDPLTRGAVRLSTLGYALPGTVLAVGIFIPVAALDNGLIWLAKEWLDISSTGFIKGTIAVMLAAYLVRFHFAGFSAVESALGRITTNIDEAARLAGVTGVLLLARIHLPLIRSGLLTAATLVFVDVMKEMPITLMTRPFGWDTLAVKIFELTSEGEWERAALPAVSLVVAGLLPLIMMGLHGERERRK